MARVPAEAVANVRNDMYLVSEAIRLLTKERTLALDADAKANLAAFKTQIDDATKFIPVWVKVAVGLPVSTTHVLSSGVAGTMAPNRSGLQMSTIRNLLLAWVLTLPAAIVLSGILCWLFRQVV